MHTARPATVADRPRAVATLAAAFAADPVVTWFLADGYPEHSEAFFGGLFDLRLAGGEVWVAAGGAAVALWDPPGGSTIPREEEQAIWRAATAGRLGHDVEQRFRAHDEAVRGLMPAECHWYLGVLGVHPDRQGRRLARAVLAPVLDRADHDGVPAALETATEGNLAIYARFGFATVAETTRADVPHSWILWRPPASGEPL